MAAANPFLMLAGPVLKGVVSIFGASAEKDAANKEAQMMKQRGDEEMASAQRQGLKDLKESEIVASNQKAAAGAGGADIGDFDDIIGRTEEVGRYNAMTAFYTGEMAQQSWDHEAAVKKTEATNKFRSAIFNTVADIGSAAMGMKFGGAKPGVGDLDSASSVGTLAASRFIPGTAGSGAMSLKRLSYSSSLR